jgi:hypothetical protein
VAGPGRSRPRSAGGRAHGDVDGGEISDVRRRMTSREAGPPEKSPRTRSTRGGGEPGSLGSVCAGGVEASSLRSDRLGTGKAHDPGPPVHGVECSPESLARQRRRNARGHAACC